MTTSSSVQLRPATGDDCDAVVALYDEAVAWLVARGRSDQWGTTPFSAMLNVVAQIHERANSGSTWVADTGTKLLGAIVLGDKPPGYIDQPAGEPEVYISGFITSRVSRAHNVGAMLLEHARATARQAGISLLRLDCYAGGDGRLVRYYESVGFRQVTRFTVELFGAPYTGCLLQHRLTQQQAQDVHRSGHSSRPE